MIFASALIAVATVAIFYASRLTYEEHVRQLTAETGTMAATVVVYVNRNLEAADSVAATASRHPRLQQLDPEAAIEVLRPMVSGRNGVLGNAVMAGIDGRPIAWARTPNPSVEGRLDEALLRTVVESAEPRVSQLLGAPGDSTHAIVLAYPIAAPGGEIVGALGLSVHLEALERILGSIPLPDGSVVTLTDADSVVVARSLESAQYVGRRTAAQGRQMRPADVPASQILTGIDGIERVFSNGVVERGPWLASVGIPTAVAWARTVPVFRRNLLIAGLSTAVVFVMTLTTARRWLSAFDHLDETANRVSRGDLSPLEQKRMPTAEMAHLQQTLDGMITSLRNARESIASQVDDERRMREEVQRLQQQVVRQERLAAIGVLVSGVAHELNNPLQAILGFSELLQMQPGMPEDARADLTLIQKESARASAIIRNLSRFGRQMAEPAPVRLRDIVASVLELRQRKLEELDIRVEVDERSNAMVTAMFTELQQVLLNFAINAEQAIVHAKAERREVTIRTGDRDGWAWVEVEDSGPGVAPKHEAKLFQPFYTTKPVGEGTGLGLSVSYDIVRSHGGRIGYRRASSGGAVFFFELPITIEQTSSDPDPVRA